MIPKNKSSPFQEERATFILFFKNVLITQQLELQQEQHL